VILKFQRAAPTLVEFVVNDLTVAENEGEPSRAKTVLEYQAYSLMDDQWLAAGCFSFDRCSTPQDSECRVPVFVLIFLRRCWASS
jgi:hypothetical protein